MSKPERERWLVSIPDKLFGGIGECQTWPGPNFGKSCRGAVEEFGEFLMHTPQGFRSKLAIAESNDFVEVLSRTSSTTPDPPESLKNGSDERSWPDCVNTTQSVRFVDSGNRQQIRQLPLTKLLWCSSTTWGVTRWWRRERSEASRKANRNGSETIIVKEIKKLEWRWLGKLGLNFSTFFSRSNSIGSPTLCSKFRSVAIKISQTGRSTFRSRELKIHRATRFEICKIWSNFGKKVATPIYI